MNKLLCLFGLLIVLVSCRATKPASEPSGESLMAYKSYGPKGKIVYHTKSTNSDTLDKSSLEWNRIEEGETEKCLEEVTVEREKGKLSGSSLKTYNGFEVNETKLVAEEVVNKSETDEAPKESKEVHAILGFSFSLIGGVFLVWTFTTYLIAPLVLGLLFLIMALYFSKIGRMSKLKDLAMAGYVLSIIGLAAAVVGVYIVLTP